MAGESGTCAQCGEPIIGEDPSQRKTCPKCGSTSRNFETSQHVTTSSSITVRAEVDTYSQRLLRVARTFIEQSEFGIAVVVAHMACEIAAERSLSEAFAAKGVQFLQDWVRGLNLGYNLANGRVQRLYTTLTGDEVQKAAFWQIHRILRAKKHHCSWRRLSDRA